jgi:hypothetical protein
LAGSDAVAASDGSAMGDCAAAGNTMKKPTK